MSKLPNSLENTVKEGYLLQFQFNIPFLQLVNLVRRKHLKRYDVSCTPGIHVQEGHSCIRTTYSLFLITTQKCSYVFYDY